MAALSTTPAPITPAQAIAELRGLLARAPTIDLARAAMLAIDALDAAKWTREPVVARVNGADLHAEAAELRAEVDRLAGEREVALCNVERSREKLRDAETEARESNARVGVLESRVRALCEAIDEGDVSMHYGNKAAGLGWQRVLDARNALRTAGKEAAAPEVEPLCKHCGKARVQHGGLDGQWCETMFPNPPRRYEPASEPEGGS